MNQKNKWAAAALCLLLAAGLTACNGEDTPSSDVSSQVSQVSSQPSSLLEDASSEESSEFVPADDLIPSEAPVSGLEDFQSVFSQNPIDKQYDDDYNRAASFSTMLQACNDASSRWERMVDVAYRAAIEVTQGEARTTLQNEQNAWSDSVDGEVEKIRLECGDSAEGTLTSARKIVLFYRQRVMDLCQIKYEADGQLPQFPSEDVSGLEPAG